MRLLRDSFADALARSPLGGFDPCEFDATVADADGFDLRAVLRVDGTPYAGRHFVDAQELIYARDCKRDTATIIERAMRIAERWAWEAFDIEAHVEALATLVRN